MDGKRKMDHAENGHYEDLPYDTKRKPVFPPFIADSLSEASEKANESGGDINARLQILSEMSKRVQSTTPLSNLEVYKQAGNIAPGLAAPSMTTPESFLPQSFPGTIPSVPPVNPYATPFANPQIPYGGVPNFLDTQNFNMQPPYPGMVGTMPSYADEEEDASDSLPLSLSSQSLVSQTQPPRTSAHRPTMRERYAASGNVTNGLQFTLPISSRKTYEPEADDDSNDDMYSDDESNADRWASRIDTAALKEEVLKYMNRCSTQDIADMTGCTLAEAEFMVAKRPFADLESALVVKQPRPVIPKGRRGRREKTPLGPRLVGICMEIMRGYFVVDALIRQCEQLGGKIQRGVENWGLPSSSTFEEGETSIVSFDQMKNIGTPSNANFITSPPASFSQDVSLQDYQIIGINWLYLLYELKLAGILADEMGLGKTCQTIAFFAMLMDKNVNGPHLVIAPASTMENWLREFAKFCPKLKIELYYGSQIEREEIRERINSNKDSYNVMLTTYRLAATSKADRLFLRNQKFNVCIYDEGHYLKNRASERYRHLMSIPADFRVLLTGTPLQNNLKELISLLAFILPHVFDYGLKSLDVIFTMKKSPESDFERALLSEQRVSRAKMMMAPFVLRRKKSQVLDALPKKVRIIEFCEFSEEERKRYDEFANKQSVNNLLDENVMKTNLDTNANLAKKKSTAGFVLVQLRKLADHPMLFRILYKDEILRKMAKAIMNEPQYKKANENYIFEDMQYMSDIELHNLCGKFSTIQPFQLKDEPWMNATKVRKLKTLLENAIARGDRIVLFSQFTQVLDILQLVMKSLNLKFLRFDGSTQVDFRQDLIDQFYADESINVFLLSTKAGGFGINLACANMVILYDVSFNPFDDLQAEDRAHRVGQKKEVTVIKFVVKNTIEEHIQRLANAKIALDATLSEKDNEKAESEETD
ncbi:fun thirty like protein Fft3 [Schizosaccharomyces cryophilus OY26]|uniref:DNA helicase n=1 Tax=Schizosaccharomyces cryophilus (strain OY26 / ATCC MYA-4695 / CBS 11777 / NBRC 106824 / NRRL Y48691) TaxID=653667 RepID=S9VZP4_SCHCR|nr:fun thirty like protein Fft3 [Schizosaccharomyces cryophilus OY26]EPY51709.1 fun thirty like protein Fft3 [Schizosaccharomyces cryophilus OY26]